MLALSKQSPPFQLGAWRVEPATGRFVRGDEVRRARALVMDLLLQLAARPGEVVSKDELIAGAWGGAAVADSALTSTIAELRELLGDQPRSPRYIETLPKRGYRLIASVTVIPLEEPEAAQAPEAPDVTTDTSVIAATSAAATSAASASASAAVAPVDSVTSDRPPAPGCADPGASPSRSARSSPSPPSSRSAG